MNINLLNIVKRIVSEQGENILADSKRLNPFFADYAKNEAKEDRVAFGRCIEAGAYQELKKTRTADERRRVKAALADQLHAKTGIDRTRCNDALDLLEAAVFKPEQPQPSPQINTNDNAPVNLQLGASTGKAKSVSVKTIIFGIAGALGGAAGELISEIFRVNDGSSTFWGNVISVAVWVAFIGLGISVGLLVAQSIYLKKKPVLQSLIKTALIGISLGAIAGGIAQVAFAFTQGISVTAEIISRIICWGIAGCGVGRGVSFFVPNFPKRRAMAAGFLGGLIGGAIFRASFSVFPEAMGRVVGIMALGFFIGLTISYIEEALREAWLTVIWGRNETKTVSLGQKPIAFGSSREADIFLANELPVRATVQIENARVVMYDKSTNQRRELQNGNQVDLGRVSFVVNTKKAIP
jgi:hypothetical protein